MIAFIVIREDSWVDEKVIMGVFLEIELAENAVHKFLDEYPNFVDSEFYFEQFEVNSDDEF